MPAFVKDLRNKWNRGELPFYFVEIAPFNYEGADGTSAARMREVQLQNMKDIPNSGMVSTLDIGHPVFIHPMDKETVGNRRHRWSPSASRADPCVLPYPLPIPALPHALPAS